MIASKNDETDLRTHELDLRPHEIDLIPKTNKNQGQELNPEDYCIKNDHHLELIKVINELYEDETAGPYYLKVILKIPTTFESNSKITWSQLARNYMSNIRKIQTNGIF